MKLKGDCPDQVHSDQMVLKTVRQEDGPSEHWRNKVKTKMSSRGAIRLKSTQIGWFS